MPIYFFFNNSKNSGQEIQNTKRLPQELVFQDAKNFPKSPDFDHYKIWRNEKKIGYPNQLKYLEKNFQPDRT